MKKALVFVVLAFSFFVCKKNNTSKPVVSRPFNFIKATVNDSLMINQNSYNVNATPVIACSFSAPLNTTNAAANVSLVGGNEINAVAVSFANSDSTLIIKPSAALKALTNYTVSISSALMSKADSSLKKNINLSLVTAIDSTDKFPQVSDSALLTIVQQQTFKYFWDFGHPVSGLARERTSSGDIVTIGGSGFGVMAILVGVNRGFVSRTDGLARVTKIVNFLTNNAQRYHGAFPHWLNGNSGATIPFSPQDDGADIVETSYMMQGLLCARQYFNSTTDAGEISLRSGINNLWDNVEWNWFRHGGQNALYWHWSPNFAWTGNQQVNGWNEALITYVMAGSSRVDSNAIPKIVYDNGWAANGNIKNGNTYLGIKLPLGEAYGGPLFFAHYSFLGINPHNLTDAYADYWTQDTAHARINYLYCVTNPNHYNGYSNLCWGLTASDIHNGYTASSPTNDVGVIAPTAAVSSLPYTPVESMNAIRFFYYKLGDKAWGQYGFTDGFNLSSVWFDTDCLAIDQGPEIVMIENYRTGLLWNLFMSCPEVKSGMKKLGFQSPNLN